MSDEVRSSKGETTNLSRSLIGKNPKLIKTPGLEMEYTPQMIKELKRCSEDPIYFIETYVRIQHPIRGEIPFIMYDFQKRIIRGYLSHRWNVVLTSRQIGKTVTSACYLLWYAIFRFDSDILITSRRNADAMDIVGKVRYAYEGLPDFIRPGVREYSKHVVAFDNGSSISAEATTENTGRGQSITILYLDEFAFVPPGIADAFWSSITPTLSTGGDCIITSTPNGDEDTFSSIWVGAISKTNGFNATEVNWWEHPDRDEEYKRQMIAKIGELKWRQEYGNEFLSSQESLISGIRLVSLKSTASVGERNGFKFWEALKPGKVYVIGVDVGTGTGGDYSTIQCFTFPQLEQVAQLRDNTIATPTFTGKLVWLLKQIDRAGGDSFYSVENNGVGEGVIASLIQLENMVDDDIPGTMIHDRGKKIRGLNTSSKHKLAACMELKNMLDIAKPKIQIRSRELITELKFYIRKGPNFNARIGATDDLISAILVMLRVTRVAADYDLEAFDRLYGIDDTDELTGEDIDDRDAFPILGDAEGEMENFNPISDYD